ncbi:response regulator transcription factor [Streptomyces capoamus]|uniref:DNA-binding response regulator n=1 Tax=Streptomyces capoamus TaxID=68183 RepID=A0A919C3P5_9ACTN|nr:response regulator transcription factor [Streptomyces capoamus]GGW19135.1 DNA-binding response regulator [Streptomyces libani subsp. rufus]GHG48554.1 DNA-binding response regulator [Streptomyces capoamus]
MLKILIAEDMAMLRRALAELLSLEADFDVVAEVDRGDEIVPKALAVRPDVAVLDIGLPGMDGITAAAALATAVPDCRVLMLTGLGNPSTLRRALATRATGFLCKDASPDQLVSAIRTVAAGKRFIDPQLAVAALEDVTQPLAPRELEVLRLAAAGEGTAAIADRLFLSAGTVRNYLSSAVVKLGARNRMDAVRIAREGGWI